VKLILARHGNTFAAGDKVFWVGGNNDLPLVSEGIAQAERVGQALKNIPLAAIYCGPLLRTREFSKIALATAAIELPITEDRRLKELDYGKWCGQTDLEIMAQFGQNALKGWVDSSVWPADGGWSSDEATVKKEVFEFVQELTQKYSDARDQANKNILVVSSNGRLRYFLHLVAGEFARRVSAHSFKVGTGRICLLEGTGSNFKLDLWNAEPQLLSQHLS